MVTQADRCTRGLAWQRVDLLEWSMLGNAESLLRETQQ